MFGITTFGQLGNVPLPPNSGGGVSQFVQTDAGVNVITDSGVQVTTS